MKLAHPPGHIFWKTEPQVDRLSLFIERVIRGEDNNDGERGGGNEEKESDTNSVHTDTRQVYTQHDIQTLVGRVYSKLFTDDLMFARVFEVPPKNLLSDSGLYFSKVGDKEYECRLFLRRFIDQNCCQVVYGAQHDIPPGMALYRLNPHLTNEQKAFVKDEWGPCMDNEGFMSPAKMFPWFAMGVVNAVQTMMDERDDGNKAPDQLLEDIVVAGEYPVVRIVIPPKKEDQRTSPYNQTSNTNLSSLLNSNNSIPCSLKTEETRSPPEAVKQKETNTRNPEIAPEKSQTKAQWYPRGREVPTETKAMEGKRTPVMTPRSSVLSDHPSSKTFSSFSREVETIQEEIKEEPYVIVLKPAIKGYGLPSGVKLQHCLPKQKPYCDIGKECIQSIHDKLEDGQSMWYLEASTCKLTPGVENSARFKSMMRKVGKESKFWNISFGPITSIIQQNMIETVNAAEFPVELEKVKQCVNILKTHHGWHCISESLVDIAVMNVVKNNMLTLRSLGQATVKTLQFLQNVADSQSCPAFLQPNVNVAQDINQEEGKWVAEEIKQVVKEIEKDPGYILLYIGYQKRND